MPSGMSRALEEMPVVLSSTSLGPPAGIAIFSASSSWRAERMFLVPFSHIEVSEPVKLMPFIWSTMPIALTTTSTAVPGEARRVCFMEEREWMPPWIMCRFGY